MSGWITITRKTLRDGEKMKFQKPRKCTSESSRVRPRVVPVPGQTELKQVLFSWVWHGVGWGPQNPDDFDNSSPGGAGGDSQGGTR